MLLPGLPGSREHLRIRYGPVRFAVVLGPSEPPHEVLKASGLTAASHTRALGSWHHGLSGMDRRPPAAPARRASLAERGAKRTLCTTLLDHGPPLRVPLRSLRTAAGTQAATGMTRQNFLVVRKCGSSKTFGS